MWVLNWKSVNVNVHFKIQMCVSKFTFGFWHVTSSWRSESKRTCGFWNAHLDFGNTHLLFDILKKCGFWVEITKFKCVFWNTHLLFQNVNVHFKSTFAFQNPHYIFVPYDDSSWGIRCRLYLGRRRGITANDWWKCFESITGPCEKTTSGPSGFPTTWFRNSNFISPGNLEKMFFI